MKKIYSILILILALAVTGQAATNYVANCNLSTVQAAANTAAPGDVLVLPPGDVVWFGNVTLNKVSLIGSGTNQTIIRDGSSSCITVADGFCEIAKIQFASGSASGFSSGIIVVGTTNAVRIHDCYFSGVNDKSIIVFGGGYNTLIDHNYFVQISTGIFVNGSGNGDRDWAAAPRTATTNVLTIENNFFTNSAPGATEGAASVVDALRGGSFCFRYNNVFNSYIETHGIDTGGRLRSVRWSEVYSNTFWQDPVQPWPFVIQFRGGSGNVFGNTVSGYSGVVSMSSYHALQKFDPWGSANKPGGWVFVSITNALTGTNDGPTGASYLQVSSANWTPNQWAGYTVTRSNSFFTNMVGSFLVTNEVYDVVESNTATRMYFLPQQTGGGYDSRSIMIWTNGDGFYMHKIGAFLDAPGRGKGDLIVDDNDPAWGGIWQSNTALGGIAWPRQTNDMICYWGNSILTAGIQKVLVTNVDYSGQPRPGLTTAVYPHPLTAIAMGAGSTNSGGATNYVTLTNVVVLNITNTVNSTNFSVVTNLNRVELVVTNPGVKISTMQTAATLSDVDLVPVVQFNGSSNVNVRATMAQIKSYAGGSGSKAGLLWSPWWEIIGDSLSVPLYALTNVGTGTTNAWQWRTHCVFNTAPKLVVWSNGFAYWNTGTTNGFYKSNNICFWDSCSNLVWNQFGVVANIDNSKCCPGDTLGDKFRGYPNSVTASGLNYPPGSDVYGKYQPPYFAQQNWAAIYQDGADNAPVNTGKFVWFFDAAGANDWGAGVVTNAADIVRVKTNLWALAQSEGKIVIAITLPLGPNSYTNGFGSPLMPSGVTGSNTAVQVLAASNFCDLVIDCFNGCRSTNASDFIDGTHYSSNFIATVLAPFIVSNLNANLPRLQPRGFPSRNFQWSLPIGATQVAFNSTTNLQAVWTFTNLLALHTYELTAPYVNMQCSSAACGGIRWDIAATAPLAAFTSSYWSRYVSDNTTIVKDGINTPSAFTNSLVGSVGNNVTGLNQYNWELHRFTSVFTVGQTNCNLSFLFGMITNAPNNITYKGGSVSLKLIK